MREEGSNPRLEVDFSGLGLRIETLPEDIEDEVLFRWHRYIGSTADAEALDVVVLEEPRALTAGREMVGTTRAELVPHGVRFGRDEGELLLDESARRATVRLAQGNAGRRAFAFLTLTTAALAWRLLARGGGALHAAGIVLEGRAFLLLGAEGAGKTTFAAASAAAGVPVISDDIVLLDAGRGRLEALAAPVRDRAFPHPGPGRWPVAALLLPRHGSPAALGVAGRLAVSAAVTANLLYVATLWRTSPRVARAAESIVAAVPARELTFPPGPSFLPLLRAAARERAGS